MTYPAPPGPPAPYGPSGPVRRRGKVPLVLGIVLLVIAIIAGVIGAISLVGAVSGASDLQRVKVADGTGTVKFDKTGKFVAYYEADDVSSSISKVPLVGVVLTSPSGKKLVVDTTYGNKSDGRIKKYTYDSGSHHGAALYEFHVSEKGTYQVALTPNSNDGPNAQIAFGKDLASGLAGGVLGVGAGVVLGLIGLVLLIVGLVMRSRSNPSKLAGPPGYAGAPAPGYAGGPAPGYGAPQGSGSPQPNYQPQQPNYQPQQPNYQPPPSYGPPPSGSGAGPDLTKRGPAGHPADQPNPPNQPNPSGDQPNQPGYWS